MADKKEVVEEIKLRLSAEGAPQMHQMLDKINDAIKLNSQYVEAGEASTEGFARSNAAAAKKIGLMRQAIISQLKPMIQRGELSDAQADAWRKELAVATKLEGAYSSMAAELTMQVRVAETAADVLKDLSSGEVDAGKKIEEAAAKLEGWRKELAETQKAAEDLKKGTEVLSDSVGGFWDTLVAGGEKNPMKTFLNLSRQMKDAGKAAKEQLKKAKEAAALRKQLGEEPAPATGKPGRGIGGAARWAKSFFGKPAAGAPPIGAPAAAGGAPAAAGGAPAAAKGVAGTVGAVAKTGAQAAKAAQTVSQLAAAESAAAAGAGELAAASASTATAASGAAAGVGGFQAALVVLTGPIGIIIAALGAVVALFAAADKQVKGMNKQILKSVSAQDMLSASFSKTEKGWANAMVGADGLEGNLLNTRQAMSKLLYVEEEMMPAFQGIMKAGMSFPRLARDTLSLAGGLQTVQTYARVWGKDFDEVGQILGDWATNLNMSIEAVRNTFSAISDDAAKSGMSTQAFINEITKASSNLGTYGSRVSDVSAMLKGFKIGGMTAKQAISVLDDVTQAFGNLSIEKTRNMAALAMANKQEEKVQKLGAANLRKQLAERTKGMKGLGDVSTMTVDFIKANEQTITGGDKEIATLLTRIYNLEEGNAKDAFQLERNLQELNSTDLLQLSLSMFGMKGSIKDGFAGLADKQNVNLEVLNQIAQYNGMSLNSMKYLQDMSQTLARAGITGEDANKLLKQTADVQIKKDKKLADEARDQTKTFMEGVMEKLAKIWRDLADILMGLFTWTWKKETPEQKRQRKERQKLEKQQERESKRLDKRDAALKRDGFDIKTASIDEIAARIAEAAGRKGKVTKEDLEEAAKVKKEGVLQRHVFEKTEASKQAKTTAMRTGQDLNKYAMQKAVKGEGVAPGKDRQVQAQVQAFENLKDVWASMPEEAKKAAIHAEELNIELQELGKIINDEKTSEDDRKKAIIREGEVKAEQVAIEKAARDKDAGKAKVAKEKAEVEAAKRKTAADKVLAARAEVMKEEVAKKEEAGSRQAAEAYENAMGDVAVTTADTTPVGGAPTLPGAGGVAAGGMPTSSLDNSQRTYNTTINVHGVDDPERNAQVVKYHQDKAALAGSSGPSK